MTRADIAPLTPWITRAALEHGHALPAHLMQRLGVSRRRAQLLLGRLVAAQWLTSQGTPRQPRHAPGALRQVVARYPLAGLQEDLPWRRDFAPCFALPAAVAQIAQHAFTELLNNAIDHSGGTQVTVSIRQTPLQLQLLVSDDGCGLFSRIGRDFAIDEPEHALLALGTGKLTSQPARHSGHGLFFTSRLADVFDLTADGRRFQRRAWDGGTWHAQALPGATAVGAARRPGTSVYFALALDTPRTLDALLQQHSRSGQGYDFSRTRVPLALLAAGGLAQLASRAEARRAAQRLEGFQCAELDFTGVQQLGHGFADERAHPQIELQPVGMAPQVAAMVEAVRAAQ
jgi:anti-sigma regulatory factor (Ser/Thr protein kinase)